MHDGEYAYVCVGESGDEWMEVWFSLKKINEEPLFSHTKKII